MGALTVASLNTFGGVVDIYNLALRYKAIADYFNSSTVDVIQFQEVFTYLHLALFKYFLSGYQYCQFQASYMGPKGGLVTFSRHQLIKHRHINYSRHFVPYLGKSIIELFTQRGLLITEIKGFSVALINTHLTAVLNADWSQKSKYYKELSSEINEFHQLVNDESLNKIGIATGDFNTAKGSDLFWQLISCPRLNDPFEKDELPTRHQCFAALGRKTNCVDYIFVFGDKSLYKVKENKRIFTERPYASDHIGLQISLTLS